MSLLSKFDELMRNSQVLQTSCEQQFLNFVTNTDENRHKWEVVELECQRLEIELNKANQVPVYILNPYPLREEGL